MNDDGMLRLHCNENPYGPPAQALAAAAEELRARTAHYPDPGSPGLRERLAEFHEVEPDMVVVGNGLDELLLLTALTFLGPGDGALVTDSTFPGYATATAAARGEVRTVPLAPGLRLPVEALTAALAEPGLRLAFVCNPHNPTGQALGPQEVAGILDRAEAAGVVPVFDEAYMEFAAPSFESALAAVREGRRLLVLRTFSKAWGLAGLRTGYAVGPRDLVGRIARTKAAVPFSVNRVAQRAAAAALAHPEHLAQARRNNAEARERLYRGLTELGVGYLPSQANFVLIEVPGNSARTAERLAEEHRIAVRDLGIFGLDRHLRVTVGTPADVDRFCRALAAVLPAPAAGRAGSGLGAPRDAQGYPTLAPQEPAALFNGYVGANLVLAFTDLGLWEALEGGAVAVDALLRRSGAEEVKLSALLRTAALLGYLKLADDTAELTPAGRELARHSGYFTWGVGGYGELMGQLAGVASGRVAFGRDVSRDGRQIAAGSGSVGRLMMLPVEEKVTAALDYSSVADLGCGDASRLIRLCAEPGRRGVGIEIDAAACASAGLRIAEAGLADRLEVVRANVLDHVDQRTFPGIDLVTSFLMMHDLFESTGDPAGVMRLLREVFPDAKQFLIADTVSQDWPALRGELPVFSLEFELVHAFMDTPILTADTYEKAFAEAGLQVERREPFGSPSTWLWLLRAS
ncbi:aminotransferase class I/II-fold pyridoxal phosphate-dependent enzyme [Kitasatospora sp. NPDC048545]|uniref:aminotransferase class I/II-fold pyridoxal phosphate-dependent enzyme n=1 Tax=Kitasatospora sp. NPDC048545 TaxID=3157208 RepID=UPI0033C1A8EE